MFCSSSHRTGTEPGDYLPARRHHPWGNAVKDGKHLYGDELDAGINEEEPAALSASGDYTEPSAYKNMQVLDFPSAHGCACHTRK